MSPSLAETPAAAPRSLAAGLAHHVNNALTVVIGRLELALREAPPGSPLCDHLEAGLECAERVAAAVHHVVALAFAAGHLTTPKRVSLRMLAEQAAKRAQGRVCLEAGCPDCPVLASEPLLRLVLDELIASARMPEEGNVVVLNCWHEAGRCCLSISNGGPAVPPDAEDHQLDPFFITRETGHLGLGLALCSDLVEAQGGDLRIISTAGQKMVVTLAFPAPCAISPSEGEEAGVTKEEKRRESCCI